MKISSRYKVFLGEKIAEETRKAASALSMADVQVIDGPDDDPGRDSIQTGSGWLPVLDEAVPLPSGWRHGGIWERSVHGHSVQGLKRSVFRAPEMRNHFPEPPFFLKIINKLV